MQVVRLRLRHPCPFAEPVARAEHVRVTHLCHRGKEAILEVHAAAVDVLDGIVDGYRGSGAEVLYEDRERTAALVRFPSCACCRSGQVIPTIEDQGYLYLPPSGYSADGETYQFLAEEERLDPHLTERLPSTVEILSTGVQPLTSLGFEGGFLVPVGVLLRGLTERQRQAIVTAILRGYYRIPRVVRTEELARALEISRPAFEALLRKAENKVVAALFPYLTIPGTAAPSAGRKVRPTAGPGDASKRREPDRASPPK